MVHHLQGRGNASPRSGHHADDAEGREALRIGIVQRSADWQACLATLPGATPFHTWDWLQIMAAALSWHFIRLGFYQADTLVGLAPLLVKQVGPYKNANWTPFPYLGPLMPIEQSRAALQALDAYQRRNGISRIQLGFAPHAGMEEAHLWLAGYSVHIDTTMIIELAGRTEADLLAGMSAKRRGRIRRAQRAGVTVRAAREDEIRTDLNAMLEEVFSRQDLPVPYPAATTGLMWERYHADPRVRMTAACYEGEAVAFSISIGDGVRANSWLAAGSDRLRNYNPLALLYWEDILWAARSGYQEYDLVGNPNPGIADYKRQFGAVERAYPVARRENSRIMAWARATYERLQPPPTNEKPDRDDSGGQQDE
jgi:hypothetical protein